MHRFAVLFFAVALPGCIASGLQLTRDRAAFDLNCQRDRIEIKMLSGFSERGTGSVFGATGCGKRATYIRYEVMGVTLNSPIQADR